MVNPVAMPGQISPPVVLTKDDQYLLKVTSCRVFLWISFAFITVLPDNNQISNIEITFKRNFRKTFKTSN